MGVSGRRDIGRAVQACPGGVRDGAMIRPFLLVLILIGVTPDIVSSQTLITSAANVRLRSAPDTGSAILTMLPLGTELELAESIRRGGWIPVRTPGGDEGWIDETLTVAVSDSTYPQVIRDLISARLNREGDGFVARAELVAFIEIALDRDWSVDDRAWLELQRLHALAATLATIPFNRDRWDDRLTSWIAARAAEIHYNEPGGHWLMNRDVILERHDMYRSTAAADDIAWFAVQNGLSGECEGFLVCYVRWSDRLEGEYLRRQPAGEYVEEAAARVRQVSEYYRSILDDVPDVFDAQSECAALHSAVASLEAAVVGSTAPERVAIASELRDMLRLCP